MWSYPETKQAVFIRRMVFEEIEGLTDRIMQTQSLIPVPPLVSNSWAIFHNKRWDIQELQPGTKFQSALTTSGDDNVGLDSFKVELLLSLFCPLAVVRKRVPQSSDFLGVVVERLQAGEDGIRLPDTLRGKDEPENTVSTSPRPNGEGEQGLDPFDVFPRFLNAGVLELEVVQTSLVSERGVSDPILEEGFDLIGAREGAKVPRQGQDISPESVGQEKVQDFSDVDITAGRRRDRGLKLFEPFPCNLDRVYAFWRGDAEALDGGNGGDWCCGHCSTFAEESNRLLYRSRKDLILFPVSRPFNIINYSGVN